MTLNLKAIQNRRLILPRCYLVYNKGLTVQFTWVIFLFLKQTVLCMTARDYKNDHTKGRLDGSVS